MVVAVGVSDALVTRYQEVIQLNSSPGSWAVQVQYKQGWRTINDKPCTVANLREMLEHKYWIASRAPADGLTDRIAFDLDARDLSDVDELFARYLAIREVFGFERVPLAYRTPSGHGVRISYRIPRTPLVELVEGVRAGLIADVLRAAGLPVAAGKIEIFPQSRIPERLPLGRDMPLLDPEDLSVLSWAAIGSSFDADLLQQGIEEMEAWYARPDQTLLDHLRSLPRVERGDPLALPGGLFTKRSRKPAPSPPKNIMRLVTEGLTEKGSRYDAEWQVGSAFLKWPAAFPQYGVPAVPSDPELADAVARWIADKSNGMSDEWLATLRSEKSRESAVRKWRGRYLRTGPDGRSMISRLRMAAMLADPGLALVAEVSDAEADLILRWAEEEFAESAIRYRFEVWSWSAFRWLKAKCLKDSRLGKLTPHRAYEGDQPFVDYDLPARTMERWPFGGGRSTRTGKPRYVDYSAAMQRIGWMRWQSGYFNPRRFNPKLPDDIKGKAKTFTFPVPDLAIRARDLRVSPATLDEVIRGMAPRMGHSITRSEAYHSLYVTSQFADLTARYKRATADRVREMAAKIRESVARLTT